MRTTERIPASFRDPSGFLFVRDGAVHRQIRKLADQRLNITALDAVAAGKGQYGMILWVKPKDYARAARALGAR